MEINYTYFFRAPQTGTEEFCIFQENTPPISKKTFVQLKAED